LPLVYAAGPEGHVEALDLLGRAAALDPGFALPRAYAALVYETRMSLRAPPLGDQDVETGIALARAALRLAGDDPLVRAVSGYVLYRLDDDVRAI
jgi:hypothetical protein